MSKIFKGFPGMTYILKAQFLKILFPENYVRNTDGNYSCATRVSGVSNNSTWYSTGLCQKRLLNLIQQLMWGKGQVGRGNYFIARFIKIKDVLVDISGNRADRLHV